MQQTEDEVVLAALHKELQMWERSFGLVKTTTGSKYMENKIKHLKNAIAKINKRII